MSVINLVDPEIAPIVRACPVLDLNDIASARTALHKVFELVGAYKASVDVVSKDYCAVPDDGGEPVQLKVFWPVGSSTTLPCLLWIQGGGYVLTSPDLDDEWCENIVLDQQCVVVSVGWRRAPEHPFPAASDDCLNALKWVWNNAAELMVDRSRLVVGGASSGGGAAAALVLRARDQTDIPLAHQLLIYPMLDDRNVTKSSCRVTDRELWNRQSNLLAWKAYLGDTYGSDCVSPYAAPARMNDLTGLCPATILSGELDLFLDENLEYAQRLIAAGVPVELHVYPAAHHGFDRHAPTAGVSRRFYHDRNDALRRAFSQHRTDRGLGVI